ncbi:MAG: Lrp/AsnC family transcriptional regulator [Anaerolineae bacterium]|nr:MAG: Lrp/AsnC family transcriptional regulator [Anaerolineae bacterium]
MLDETDRAIISYLQYDGRAPYTRIAEALGLTEGAVRRRVKNLQDAGILQIVAVVEPHELGLTEAGMIGITVEPSRIQEIAEEIARLPEVSYLFQAAGEFDLFAEVFCENRQHFVDFLNNRLQKIEGVVSTRTFIILKMHKLSYRWGHADPFEQPAEAPDLRS